MPNTEPPASHIAIKLGALSAPKTSSRPIPPSTLGKRHRPQLSNADSDSEEGDHSTGRHEAITTFGPEGPDDRSSRETRNPKQQPLMIPRQANRDWKSELSARRKHAHHAGDYKGEAGGHYKDVELAGQDKQLKWGLVVKLNPSDKGEQSQAGEEEEEGGKDGRPKGQEETDRQNPEEDAAAIKIADEEALDALLGKSAETPKAPLVIERAVGAAARLSEEDAFRRDFCNAPDASTLEEYDQMPVEEFGAALLRGMGWDGKPRGPKLKEVKRRPNQMGLGAKELKGQEDLGGWNQGGNGNNKRRPPRLDDYRRTERERQDSSSSRRHHRESYKEERERERREEYHRGHRNGYSHRRR